MTPYEQGQLITLASLGLTKYAANPAAAAKQLIPWWKRLGGGIRRTVVGQPTRFWEELKGGPRKVFGKDSLIRQGFAAPGMLGKGLMYGLPAYEAVNALTDKDPNNAKQIGQLLGRTALGYSMFSPFGLIGSTVGYTAGDVLGGGIGNLFSRNKENNVG